MPEEAGEPAAAPPPPPEAGPDPARASLAFLRLLRRAAPNEDTRFLILTAVAGIAGGLGAIGLRYVIQGAQALFLGGPANVLEAVDRLPWAWKLVAPAAAAAVGGLVVLLARRFAGGANVAVIMESVSIRRGVVSFRAALLRAVASAIAIGGGVSVGREGPIVALAAATASSLGRRARLLEDRLRVLVAAGTAGGFAAAYDTPVAATLFVLEVIVGSFAAEILGPTAVAAVMGALVSRALGGEAGGIYRPAAEYALRSAYEVPAYVLLGLGAAAGGTLFLEALRAGERLFARVAAPLPLRAALGGLAVGAIVAIGLPEVMGNGYETTRRIVEGRVDATDLALLFVAKIAATAATVGSGTPGGVFTPTLLLGAALGGALGNGVSFLFPAGAPAGAYVLVGMGAMLAATTHAPLLSVVFVFEVTRDYGIVIPLLLSCVVATIAARRLNARSVYEEELARRGLTWAGTPEERALRAIRVRDLMRSNIPVLPPSTPVQDLVRAFLTTRVGVLYIGADSRLAGAIDFQAAKGAIGRTELEGVVVAEDLMRPVAALDPDLSIVDANEALWHGEADQLPVVEPETRRFLGILTRRDVLGAIDREILRRNVLLAKVRWRADEGTVTDFFELPSGQRLEQVAVPPSLEGRTLAEADLRTRFGFNVLAVVRPRADGGIDRFSPRATDRLGPGDVLVVIATRPDLERFRALP